jgi:hypothetical protein
LPVCAPEPVPPALVPEAAPPAVDSTESAFRLVPRPLPAGAGPDAAGEAAPLLTTLTPSSDVDELMVAGKVFIPWLRASLLKRL